MIAIEGLTVRYPGQVALDDLSLHVRPGECLLVSGPSGCGKSTLAKVICGLIPGSLPAQVSGKVRVGGLDPLAEPLERLAQVAGLVFQNPGSQLFHLKVEDEIAFGPRNLGLAEAEVQKRVDWALESAGIAHLRAQRPARLSGGQQQIVAIAALLALRPPLLVLDEPTASLDVPSTRRVMETLEGLKRLGMTIVLVEHRLAEVARLADRAVILDGGRIVLDGAPDSLFEDPQIRRRLGLRRVAAAQPSPWPALMRANDRRPSAETPLLEISRLTAGYGKRAILQDVDLQIYPGDFTALVGDNGAGKSTLGLAAAGLLKPWSGKVRFMGGRKPRPGQDVMLLFQNPAEQLFCDAVDEEVGFGPRNLGCFSPERHEQTLAEADLLALRARRPTALSVGQQQRAALAACLALRPKLLILDEPTLGQDWGHLQRLMNFLQTLNRQGMAILLITHDYKLVHRYAHKVILLEGGAIKISSEQSGGANP